jgi:hypothetical protein
VIEIISNGRSIGIRSKDDGVVEGRKPTTDAVKNVADGSIVVLLGCYLTHFADMV